MACISMKPVWLNKKINLKSCSSLKEVLRDLRLDTVCEQAMCPNIGECFLRNEATFLILGRHCTRMCSFCNIKKAAPLAVDVDEPIRVAQGVKRLNLKHVVITSVTRDDLSDGGAGIFAETVSSIKKASPRTTTEVLIPDFQLSLSALKTVADSQPDIIAHNLETVPSLYKTLRQGGNYPRSLSLLRIVKDLFPDSKTKSGLMLGVGEKQREVLSVMRDLRFVKCDFLSIGQYLAPSKQHHPVKNYIRPEKFEYYKEEGKGLGFLHIKSGPYIRSSYLAADYLSNKKDL